MRLLQFICKRRERATREDREHEEKLMRAESDLRDLQARGDRAVRYLVERRTRNHWREAIEQMIQGV